MVLIKNERSLSFPKWLPECAIFHSAYGLQHMLVPSWFTGLCGHVAVTNFLQGNIAAPEFGFTRKGDASLLGINGTQTFSPLPASNRIVGKSVSLVFTLEIEWLLLCCVAFFYVVYKYLVYVNEFNPLFMVSV